MQVIYNETFERDGVGHGPFRVLVATNVMARILGKPDDIFDVVYYFGRVTEQENIEEFLYEPYTSGNAAPGCHRKNRVRRRKLKAF